MGAKSKALNDTLVAGLSDIRFTDTNRVPSSAARFLRYLWGTFSVETRHFPI